MNNETFIKYLVEEIRSMGKEIEPMTYDDMVGDGCPEKAKYFETRDIMGEMGWAMVSSVSKFGYEYTNNLYKELIQNEYRRVVENG